MATQLGKLVVDIEANTTKFVDGINGAVDVTKELDADLKKVFNLMKKGALVATAAFAAAITMSIAKASKFDKTMDSVALGLDGLSEDLLPEMAQGLRDMSIEFGLAADDLGEGLASITQAGIDPAKAMDVLAASSQLVVAGVDDQASVIEGLTRVIKAYSIDASRATDVTDWFVAVARAGGIPIATLASVIGDVATTAANCGLPMDELGAAIATMTAGGLSAEQAVMALNGILTAFLKPTDAAKDAAYELGFELNTNTLKTMGLVPVLQLLSGATEEQQAKILGNTRAFKGLTEILQDTQGYQENLKTITESTGMTFELYKKQTDDVDVASGQLMATLSAIAVVIGDALKPLTVDILNYLKKEIPEILPSIIGYIEEMIKVIAAMIGNIVSVKDTFVMVKDAVVIALTGLIDNLYYLGEAILKIALHPTKIWEAVSELKDKFLDSITDMGGALDDNTEKWNTAVDTTESTVASIQTKITAAADKIKTGVEDVGATAKATLTSVDTGLDYSVKNLAEKANEAEKEEQDFWQHVIADGKEAAADWSKAVGDPIIDGWKAIFDSTSGALSVELQSWIKTGKISWKSFCQTFQESMITAISNIMAAQATVGLLKMIRMVPRDTGGANSTVPSGGGTAGTNGVTTGQSVAAGATVGSLFGVPGLGIFAGIVALMDYLIPTKVTPIDIPATATKEEKVKATRDHINRLLLGRDLKAFGAPYINQEGMYYLHQGERVVTKQDNAGGAYSGGGINIQNSFVITGEQAHDQSYWDNWFRQYMEPSLNRYKLKTAVSPYA